MPSWIICLIHTIAFTTHFTSIFWHVSKWNTVFREKKKHLGWNLIFILLKLIILWKVTIFFFFFNWFIYFLNLLHAFILVAFTIQDPSDKLGVGFYTRKLSHLNFSWSILFSFFFSFSYIHTHTHTLKLSVSEWQLALRLSWLVPLIESWRQTGLVQ